MYVGPARIPTELDAPTSIIGAVSSHLGLSSEVIASPQRDRETAYARHIEQISENYEAFWVAVEPMPDGEAVVGMLAVAAIGAQSGVPEPAFIDRSIRADRVHWLLVAPERQRRGIGRRLVDAAIAWARANGYEALLLDTTTEQQAAVAFYEALDFSEVGRSTVRRWELVWFKLAL